MKYFKCAVAALGLLGLGCQFAWGISFGPIGGVVHDMNGAPVFGARVWIVGGASTYTDMLGHYRLPVRAVGETVTVLARDGYAPGAYAETHSGSVSVVVRKGGSSANIVLDHAEPI